MQEKRPRSTTISSTTVSSMPPGAPGALPVLPLGMCWQLQDGPDYHLSWGRGQGRLRRCGGVLWAFKRRKCVEIAKRALLAHLGLEHAEGTFLECTLLACDCCVLVQCDFSDCPLSYTSHRSRQVDSDCGKGRRLLLSLTQVNGSSQAVAPPTAPLSPPC
jgi:hypothetical protein